MGISMINKFYFFIFLFFLGHMFATSESSLKADLQRDLQSITEVKKNCNKSDEGQGRVSFCVKRDSFLKKIKKYKEQIIVTLGVCICLGLYVFNKKNINQAIPESQVNSLNRLDTPKITTEIIPTVQQKGQTCGMHALFNALLLVKNQNENNSPEQEKCEDFIKKAYELLCQDKINKDINKRKQKVLAGDVSVKEYTDDEIKGLKKDYLQKETLGNGEFEYLFYNDELAALMNLTKDVLPDQIISICNPQDLNYGYVFTKNGKKKIIIDEQLESYNASIYSNEIIKHDKIIVIDTRAGHHKVFLIIKESNGSIIIKGADSNGNPDFRSFQEHPLIKKFIDRP